MTKIVSAFALGAAMLFATAAANASTWVDFMIVGTPSEPGTISGRLEFDTTGVGVAATGLYIDSIDTATTRFKLFSNDNLIAALSAYQNAFTVSADGIVTSASLYLHGTDATQQAAGVASNFFQLNAGGGYNDYEQDFSYPYPYGSSFASVSNQGGFAGVTYTPEASAAVPEPAAWTMMIGGFGLIGAALRRRRIAASTSVTFG